MELSAALTSTPSLKITVAAENTHPTPYLPEHLLLYC